MRLASMAVPGSAWARLQLAGLQLFAGPAVGEAAKAWLYRELNPERGDGA